MVFTTVMREAEQAPLRERTLIEQQAERPKFVDSTADIVYLRQAYLRAGIVTARWEVDALHIASATVAECRMLVSWNFGHIVHFDEIARYNGVNVSEGYGEIGIYAPQEVIEYED
jgi:hypothetical protein